MFIILCKVCLKFVVDGLVDSDVIEFLNFVFILQIFVEMCEKII